MKNRCISIYALVGMRCCGSSVLMFGLVTQRHNRLPSSYLQLDHLVSGLIVQTGALTGSHAMTPTFGIFSQSACGIRVEASAPELSNRYTLCSTTGQSCWDGHMAKAIQEGGGCLPQAHAQRRTPSPGLMQRQGPHCP